MSTEVEETYVVREGVSLGDRMKGYEKEKDINVEYDNFIVVRIDGHKFSKFTKNLIKPFDEIFSKTMVQVTEGLFKDFGAVTGYTQSDEITLIFQQSYKQKKISIPQETSAIKTDNMESRYGCGMGNETFSDEDCTYWENKETGEWGAIQTYEEADREECTITYYIGDDSLSFQTIYGAQSSRDYGPSEDKIKDVFDKYEIFNLEIRNNAPFGGRVQKISSLTAGFASMAFNRYFEENIELVDTSNPEKYGFKEQSELDEYIQILKDKIGKAYFDARTFAVPTEVEAYNALMWRVRDAEKNSRSMFAQTYCSHKSLLNKNGLEQVEFCKTETGMDWESIDDKYKFGVLVKKEEYQKSLEDGTTTTRSRVISFVEKLTTFSDDNVELVMAKYRQQ